jgi:hypothetical protein
MAKLWWVLRWFWLWRRRSGYRVWEEVVMVVVEGW